MPLSKNFNCSISIDGETPKNLILGRMRGHEALGRLFEYHLDIISEEKPLAVANYLGKTLKLTLLNLDNIGTPTDPKVRKRSYTGIVAEFHQLGVFDADFSNAGPTFNYCYRIVIRPKLWLLTRTSRCRFFQETTINDVIETVLKEHRIDYQVLSSSNKTVHEYCVQYRESDFDFISRLMEQEGLYYYFEAKTQSEDARLDVDTDLLLITDSKNSHLPITSYEGFSHASIGGYIHEWHRKYEISSNQYELRDFDFKTQALTSVLSKAGKIGGEGTRYDYVPDYNHKNVFGESNNYAKIRLEELHTNHEVILGKSEAWVMYAGMPFRYKAQYPGESENKCIITEVEFSIKPPFNRSGTGPFADFSDVSMEFSFPEENVGDTYINRFTAMPESQQFRPSRITPIPAIHGTQTAVVTEDVDQYGRVKVKFPWFTEKSSCWIRVSQPMAGKKWGWISLPRVGQEVIVSFEEGNPNRPIITGRVYNDKSMPPYELPANKTQSGIKTCGESSSSKFNELRFEDKQDNEEIFLHAEKDLKCVILNDEIREITQNRTVTIKSGNDTLKVEKGKYTIEADTSIELKVGSNSILIDKQGITIKGATVKIEGVKSLDAKSSIVKIEGTATLDAKSPLTTVSADGVLTLKGGLTKIN